MMNEKSSTLKTIPILKASLMTALTNKQILFPFFIVAFFQFLALELIYFLPRFPLNVILGPLVRYRYAEIYMHYPTNFILLPKLYQLAQIPIYIFISSICIAFAVKIIAAINEERDIKASEEFFGALSSYLYLVLTALLSFVLVISFFKGYGLLVQRAIAIRSQSGLYYIIKRIVIDGAPYFNLLLSVFVTMLVAYVIPVIVLEKKKLFSAIGINFKILFKSFFTTFFVIFIPSLFYAPVLLLRRTVDIKTTFPEMAALLVVLGIVVMFFIDAVIYTSITTIYLIKRGEK